MNVAVSTTRRPRGVTALCVLLGYLAIAGLGNALVLPGAFPGAIAPELLRTPANIASWVLAAAALLYAITAITAAVGLWRLRSWGLRAFLAWIIAVCLFAVVFLLLVRLPADTPPLLGSAFTAFMAFLLVGGWVYIRRVYARANLHAL